MKRTVRPWAIAILACAVSVALSIPVVLARDPGNGSSGRGSQLEMEMKMQARPIMEADGVCICKKTSSTGDTCSSGYYWNCRDGDDKTCGKDGDCT